MGRMQAIGMTWTYLHEYRTVDDELKAFDAVTWKRIREVLDRYPLDRVTTLGTGAAGKARTAWFASLAHFAILCSRGRKPEARAKDAAGPSLALQACVYRCSASGLCLPLQMLRALRLRLRLVATATANRKPL